MKKLVVLSGAGISAESGLSTFREAGGLWDKYDIYEVATPEAWENNPDLVLEFYNARRKQLYEVEPNEAHFALAKLEKEFEVNIITQNVDDLHERGGSKNILHLHGELKKVRSTLDPNLIYDWNKPDLNKGDVCELGSQLRPHIVWFGEPVPAIEDAIPYFQQADICLAIGTSLNVYPAAGLIQYIPKHCELYLIDPNDLPHIYHNQVKHIQEKAVAGMKTFMKDIRFKG